MSFGKWLFTAVWFYIVHLGFGAQATVGAELQKLTVFAAASTTYAVTDIARQFEKTHPIMVRLSFASSSTLAKQINNGAPADIFLSANSKWMDYLVDKSAIVPHSRLNLLSNRIVLIAPKSSPIKNVSMDSTLDLPHLLGDGRLAMGDPDHVPAGMYGKQALEKLELWHAVKDRLARTKDVCAALVLVQRAEAPLGQVYATDAAISQKVRIVGMFPQASHAHIIYPLAMVKETDAAKTFITFMRSEASKKIFQKYGFRVR